MKKVQIYKRLFSLGLVFGILLPVVLPLFLLVQPASAVPAPDSGPSTALPAGADTARARVLDTERRKLHAALTCLNDSILDTDDDISDFNDLFHDRRWAGADKFSQNAEIAVWGLDINDNGVASCKNALEAALAILGEGTSDNEILSALTDGTRTSFNESFPGSELAAGYPKFRDKIIAARDEKRQKIITENGAPVYDYLLRERLFSLSRAPLVSLCYKAEHPDNATRPPTGANDFTVNLSDGTTANFLYKGDSGIRNTADTDNGGWYDDDGAGGRPSRIGDIQMVYDANGYSPPSDSFYPFGTDRTISNKSYGFNTNTAHGIEVTKGVAACALVKDNKDFIFGDQFRFNTSKVLELVNPVSGAPTTTPPPGSGGETGVTEDDSCEATGGVMAWIICPVIKLLDAGIGYLDTKIGELLEVPPGRLSTPEMQAAQKRIRNFAYIILVPIMLVMVISTALGFEFISAYTVKKALPRLVIAAIFIAVSPQITGFLIDLTNAVGKGIAGLILQPLLGTSTASLSSILNPGQGAATSAGVGIFAVGAAIVIGPAIIGMLLSYAFVTFVVLFIAFAILGIRQVLILMLALLAPLAILSWIFPGNDKLWKIWWGTFTKLLLLFPIIAILIASGKAFASMVGSAQQGILGTLLTVTAYLVPYFFIPAAFKWAGGVFAAITGMVNDRGKGLFDRQKAFRAKTASEGYRDFKTGAVGSGARGAFSRSVGQRIGVGAKGRFGLGSQEKFSQARDQLERKAMVENVMKGPAWDGVNNNDDALHAATYGNASLAATGLQSRFVQAANEKAMRDHGRNANADEVSAAHARADRAVKAVQTSIGFGRPQAVAAAQQLVSIGTGYDNVTDMTQTLARASGGNRNTASALAGFANAETKKVGRNDLAPGFGNLDAAVRAEGGMLGATEDTPMTPGQLTAAGWNSGSLYGQANGKPQSLKNSVAHFESELASGDSARVETAAVFFKELDVMKNNAIGENAIIVNETLDRNSGRLSALDDATKARVSQKARSYERPDPNTL